MALSFNGKTIGFDNDIKLITPKNTTVASYVKYNNTTVWHKHSWVSKSSSYTYYTNWSSGRTMGSDGLTHCDHCGALCWADGHCSGSTPHTGYNYWTECSVCGTRK